VQCAFRAKPIFRGRSDWAASFHPELIGKKRRLLLLFMIFHKCLSQHPNSSKSKTTRDPDRSIFAWLDPGTQGRKSPLSRILPSIRSILRASDCGLRWFWKQCAVHLQVIEKIKLAVQLDPEF
jgi:hypothetical protein